MSSIKVDNISKSFLDHGKSTQVLDGLSFEIAENEFISIIGPNGCGKSTLFSILLGITKTDSGSLNIESGNRKLGFVFQNYRDSLLPWETVLENITLPMETLPISKDKKIELARKILKEFKLEKFQNSYIYQISGGMAQLVSLARAFVIEPELLLIDEPFSALDYSRSIKMQEMLSDVWQEKQMTTIMISHNIDEAIYLSDKIIILTQRPAKIKEIIVNNLPRPRKFETRMTNEFENLRKKILRVIENNENNL